MGMEQTDDRGQSQSCSQMIRANPANQRSWAPSWWAVFIIGLLLWGAAIGVTLITGNVITLPTIVLIGSFLVPVTGVVWYLDHDPSPALSPRRITAAFIIAGTLGVLAASLLEYYLVGTGLLANFEVGLVEELVKTLMVVAVAWGIHSFHTRDGMVLGAYVLVSVLHGAFDSINGITGYVVVSIVGLIPLVWLWLRVDGRGGVLPRVDH